MSYFEMQTTEIGKAQFTEALHRMKKLKLHENVIRDFTEKGNLNLSEICGILFWLDEREEKLVRNWEKLTGSMVYHVIKSQHEFGLCYSFLYVSAYPDEWEYDRENLDAGYPIAYVHNDTFEFLSEYGSIGIEPQIGGLVRTA